MKIEILGRKEDLIKMQSTLKVLQRAVTAGGIQADIRLTHDFRAFAGAAFNPAKTPVVFINGSVEFSGNVPEMKSLLVKIQQLKSGGAGAGGALF